MVEGMFVGLLTMKSLPGIVNPAVRGLAPRGGTIALPLHHSPF